MKILAGAVVGCAVMLSAARANPFPAPGEWPGYRRNPSQDARSPLHGNITQPQVVWKHFVGMHETVLLAEPSASQALAVDGQDSNDPRWGLASPTALIGGTVQSVPSDIFVTYADVLPGAEGWEKLEVRREGTALCSAWRHGVWEKVWETEKMDFGNTVTALPIAGDFDADGAPELAFLPWWNLVLVDARTGKFKEVCRFTEGRSYGYFGAHDLDGDGKFEFVVQADFAKHVDVLGYRDGKLQVLWQKPIELDISNPRTVLRVPPKCVADVDGDGKKEVLVNLWNGSGDGRWHVTVHDGISGAINAELADECLQGVVDLDGDGAEELLTARTAGAGVPGLEPIRVHGFSQGRDEVRWEQQDVGWTFWEPSPPPYVNSGATFARRTALARSTPGGALAVVRCGGSGGGLRVVRWREGRFDAIFTLPGAELHALSLDLEGRLLARVLHVSESAPPLSAEQARITPFATCPAGIAPGPVAVTKPDAENLPILVVQGNAEANEASGQLVAFHPPATDESSQDLWRIAGRGQSTNWPNTLGPVVADLRGDGGRQLLYSTAAPSGCARFAAMELDGKECWTHDFAEIPGTPPVWNSGGIVLWQAGHFTDPVRQEVLVTVRRSMMHSEETLLLNGSDGRVLWRVARENTDMHSRGVGGTPFAVADFDGDGLDDAASFYPSLFYVLKGTSGANLLLMNAAWDAVPEKPIYWGSAVAGAFESGRKPGAFMAGGDMTALVRGDGTLAWWDALHQSPTQFAFGYFNGDGKTEAMGFGYPDGIRCYDPADGRVQWSMLLPTGCAPTGTASADLNGDGRDEALLTSASMLYCFGASAEGTAGAMLWSILLPAALGPPTVAELEEVTVILCAAQDGFVYCLR